MLRDFRFHSVALLALFGVALAAPLAPSHAAGVRSGSTQEPMVRAHWVFFTDRGSNEVRPELLVRLAEGTSAASWAARSAGHLGVLPDEKDLPLADPYVQRVASLGELRHRSKWLNAVSANLTAEALEQVQSLPFVRETRPVARARIQSLGPDQGPDGEPLERTLPSGAAPSESKRARGPDPYGTSYGQLLEINVPAVHASGYTGNRVRVMMLDTGFRKEHHAFLQTRILAEHDFVFGDGETQNEPEDDPNQHFHGTGTWAVAGGYDPGHIVGPAYGAEWVLSKTEDIRTETEVEEDNYVAALEWADSLGVRVTSASLSYTCFDDGFCYDYPLKDGDTPVISRAVDIAAARGILCVNAAGNYGSAPMSLGTPADADSIVSVGAVDSLNVIASFSSRGPSDDGRTKPEVVARGRRTWWADASAIDSYGYASGTSLSCPLVGGAAALLAEAHPEWGAMDIRGALMSTADRHSAPNNDYGWGRIDVLQALHSGAILFPLPFDLSSPADGAQLDAPVPTFRWRASHDLDGGGPVSYQVHLWDPEPGGAEWVIPSGFDTVLTLGFALNPNWDYRWEVYAEDLSGHRRISRQSWTIHTSGASEVGPSAPVTSRLDVRVQPNPFSGSVRFELVSSGDRVQAEPVRWAVYDPIGRKIAQSPGASNGESGVWDGTDPSGRPAPAGVYYLELSAGNQAARRVLVKLPGSGR